MKFYDMTSNNLSWNNSCQATTLTTGAFGSHINRYIFFSISSFMVFEMSLLIQHRKIILRFSTDQAFQTFIYIYIYIFAYFRLLLKIK